MYSTDLQEILEDFQLANDTQRLEYFALAADILSGDTTSIPDQKYYASKASLYKKLFEAKLTKYYVRVRVSTAEIAESYIVEVQALNVKDARKKALNHNTIKYHLQRHRYVNCTGPYVTDVWTGNLTEVSNDE